MQCLPEMRSRSVVVGKIQMRPAKPRLRHDQPMSVSGPTHQREHSLEHVQRLFVLAEISVRERQPVQRDALFVGFLELAPQ